MGLRSVAIAKVFLPKCLAAIYVRFLNILVTGSQVLATN